VKPSVCQLRPGLAMLSAPLRILRFPITVFSEWGSEPAGEPLAAYSIGLSEPRGGEVVGFHIDDLT
jgi:hypothetical protein